MSEILKLPYPRRVVKAVAKEIKKVDRADAVKLAEIQEQLKALRDQVGDAAPVIQRLNRIEALLNVYVSEKKRRNQLYDLEMEVLKKFDAALAKEINK